MKSLFPFILLFSTAFGLYGQSRQFYPSSTLSFPDIHPDSLKKYEAILREYKEIIKADHDQLTEPQRAFIEEYEMLLGERLYYTGPIGCSWYCAAGPETIRSSSDLDSSKVATYSAGNVHDFDMQSAWVEAQEGYGIGEYIEFEFSLSEGLSLTELTIYNGYAKNLKTWKANSRVKTLELKINGEKAGVINLSDTYYGQQFDIGSFGGDANGKLVLRLEILDVYKGEKYADTGISEINFSGTGDH